MIAQAIYSATLQAAYELPVEFSFLGNRNCHQSHHLKTSQLRLSEQFLTHFHFIHVTSFLQHHSEDNMTTDKVL